MDEWIVLLPAIPVFDELLTDDMGKDEMKIVIACHVRWFNAEAYYAFELARYFCEAGHNVWLSVHPDSPLAQKAATLAVSGIQELDILHSSPKTQIQSLKRFIRWMRDKSPSLVTVHRSESYFFSIIAQRFLSKKACVLRFRGDPRPPRGSWLNKWLYQNNAHGLIFSGELLRQAFLDVLSVSASKTGVLYAPIDTDRFFPRVASLKTELRNRFGLPGDVPIIGVVGRIGKVKGHEYLLRTIELLPQKYVSAHFFIAYHEEHDGVRALKNDVISRGLASQISFFSKIETIHELIASADVGMISSVGSEANCRVALEFMSCGVPLIATRVGVIPEVVVDGETGYIVEAKAPHQSAEKLVQLLDDEIRRKRMGEQARRHVSEKYALPVFHENLSNLIHRFCPELQRKT